MSSWGSQQSLVNINFTAYGNESDPGPMPVPSDAPIEGYPTPGTGDRHVLVLDNNSCWLYELYNSYANSDGSWNADSAAVWDLLKRRTAPPHMDLGGRGRTSRLRGLARYDEVASGSINHALRFTLQSSRAAFVPPASHWAANSSNQFAAPMGMRMRLKASFNISSFSPANQVILKALQKYGMIMADNGSEHVHQRRAERQLGQQRLTPTGKSYRVQLRSRVDESCIHGDESAPRLCSGHQQLHCKSRHRFSRNASHTQLECDRSFLLCCVSRDRGSSRQFRYGSSLANDNVHSCGNQSVRTHHRQRHHHDSLGLIAFHRKDRSRHSPPFRL